MRTAAPTPDELLADLYRDLSGWLELTFMAPVDTLKPKIVTDWYPLPFGGLDWDRIHTMNQRGYGVHYSLCPRTHPAEPDFTPAGVPIYRRGSEADVHTVAALWADLDWGVTPENTQRVLWLDGPPPNVKLITGGGYQLIWFIRPVLLRSKYEIKVVKHHLKQLAAALGGDVNVAELSRDFRLPGTRNTKPTRQNAPVTILWHDTVDYVPVRYPTIAGITQHLVQAHGARYLPPPPPDQPRTMIPLPDNGDTPYPQWVNDYLTAGAPEGTRNVMAYTVARFLLDLGENQPMVHSMITTRALADGLNDPEIRSILASAAHAPRHAVARWDDDRWRSRMMIGNSRLFHNRRETP